MRWTEGPSLSPLDAGSLGAFWAKHSRSKLGRDGLAERPREFQRGQFSACLLSTSCTWVTVPGMARVSGEEEVASPLGACSPPGEGEAAAALTE